MRKGANFCFPKNQSSTHRFQAIALLEEGINEARRFGSCRVEQQQTIEDIRRLKRRIARR